MDDSLKKLLAADAAAQIRTSVWELTWDALSTCGATDPQWDAALPTPYYEVGIGATFTPTTPEVFDAWTGPRRLNGLDHHGPVFHLGTTIPYSGPRHCGCHTCESATDPTAKKN